jgi:hypothetical protein
MAMNRFVAFLLFLPLLFTGAAPGFAQGVNALAIGKAKSIRDANNAQQGVAPAQPGSPVSAAPATNAPRGIDPAQQANIDKLGDDLAAIKAGVRVPLDQRQQIQADALVLAKGAAKPSPQSLTNLVKDLSLAIAGKSVNLKETSPAQLAHHLNIIVNSMNLTPGQVQAAIIAARNLLLTSGVPEDDYKPVVADLNAIVTELQKNKPKPSP